jgi:hypothetical protein
VPQNVTGEAVDRRNRKTDVAGEWPGWARDFGARVNAPAEQRAHPLFRRLA